MYYYAYSGEIMYSFIARQPILNADKALIAYELLFRDGQSNSFPKIDPDQATSNILTHNHLTMGVEDITSKLPAFINFHANTLIKNFPNFLNPDNVIIEILEDVPATDTLLKRCIQLSKKGYKLALDDYDFDPKWQRFLPYISIIKVDILALSMLDISKFVRRLNPSDITLLAEKVETVEQFEQLKLMGFTLFQGYFFSKPEMLKQKRLSNTKQNIMKLIEHACNSDFNFNDLSDIFSSDPALTYKLLRFINSPFYGRSQNITSLKHALIYIGDTELKKFIALLALADLSQDKPSEIMRLSLIRARFCEQLSLFLHISDNPPKAFLTGILSMIDGILDRDLISVLDLIPIHQDIKCALLTQNSQLTDILTLSKEIERGHWQHAEQLVEKLQVSDEKVHEMQTNAITWADEMLSH